MRMRKFMMCAGALSLAIVGHAMADATDNFSSYANAQDLIGAGNGQISYANGTLHGTPLLPGDYFQATNADSTSPPNSGELHDTTTEQPCGNAVGSLMRCGVGVVHWAPTPPTRGPVRASPR